MANRSSQDLTDTDKLEIHLTLVLDPSNCSRLEDLPLMQDGWQDPQEWQLTLTYFDARGWPLTNSNLSLWVEREGRPYRPHLQITDSRVGVAAVCKVQESPIATSRPALSGLAD